MRDLVLWPGIELGLPALRLWSLSHWTTREAPSFFTFWWSFFIVPRHHLFCLDPETLSSHSLPSNVPFLANFISPPGGKCDSAVVIHSAMAPWKPLLLKQYRSSHPRSILMRFTRLRLQHHSWCCVVHCAACESWLLMTLSEVVPELRWWWPQMHVLLSEWVRKPWV